MLEAGLAGARFFHLACAIILFGGTSFVLYSRLDVGRSKRLALLPAILATAALGALLSGLAWFVLTAANMSGALVDALDRETLSSVLWDTSFGLVWALRVPLMILILAVIWWRRAYALSRHAIALLSFLAAILLASLAGVGHTQVHEGVSAGVHVTADAVHLLAAGAWLGGLLPLCLFLAPDQTAQVSNDEAVRILSRFSGMGYVAVAVLIASGSINSWFLIGSLPHLIDTSYGQCCFSHCPTGSGLFRPSPNRKRQPGRNVCWQGSVVRLAGNWCWLFSSWASSACWERYPLLFTVPEWPTRPRPSGPG